MKITVKCTRPKYAKGDHEFARFEDVFHWLAKIKCLSRAFPGCCLYSLAEIGVRSDHRGQLGIEMHSDFCNPSLAKKVGYETGLLRVRELGEPLSKERAVALDFARQIDKQISASRP